MADISQIKIGSTTYDISDATLRNTLNNLIYSRNCTATTSVSANSTKSFNWTKTWVTTPPSGTTQIFLGWTELNTASTLCVFCTVTEDAALLRNVTSTASGSISPNAVFSYAVIPS